MMQIMREMSSRFLSAVCKWPYYHYPKSADSEPKNNSNRTRMDRDGLDWDLDRGKERLKKTRTGYGSSVC